jgi:shikimate kinase
MNIILIGYRGTGKSTIGKRLADKLGRDFVDTDLLLVERAGKTIREIFDTEGEKAFRDRESAVIMDVAARDNVVVAAGGGAILRPENVASLKKNGKVIWLQADSRTLHARIAADPATAASRPSLTAIGGALEEIQHLLAQRTPAYQSAADSSLDVSRLSIDDAVNHLAGMV